MADILTFRMAFFSQEGNEPGKLQTRIDRIEDLLYSQTYPKYIPLENPRGIRDLDFNRRDTSDWSSWGDYSLMLQYGLSF